MSRREPGRAVITHHARDEKAIVQPKVGPAEKRREPAFRRVGRGRSRGGGIEAVEAVGVGEESDAPSHHPVRLELAVFVATHDVEAVALPDLAVVGEERLQRLCGVFQILLLREPVPQRPAQRVRDRVVLLPSAVGMVQPHVDLRRQTMYHVELGLGVPEGPGRLAEVYDLICQRHRIACCGPANLEEMRSR